jgi:glycosyltransferase involved in cell wall biosynthesis
VDRDLARATVLVPAYNEAEAIGVSLRRIQAILNVRADYIWELVVVDDGSVDSTSAAAAAAEADLTAELIVVRHRENQGLGGALRTGFARSTGAVVITVDSDLSYPPEIILDLLAAWESRRAHIVIASPYMPGGRTTAVPPTLERRSRMANRILSATALGHLHTLTGLVRAYDGAFVRSLSLKAADVDINAEIIYKTQLLRGTIVEIPAELNWHGLEARTGRGAVLSRRSRWNTAKSLVISYLFRPFLFPLLPIPFLVAIAVVAAVFGGISAPTVFTSAVVAIVILVMASLAMLQAKRYFEELFTISVRSGRPIDAPGHPVAEPARPGLERPPAR